MTEFIYYQQAQDLCNFVNAAPTPTHAVEEVIRRASGAGFTLLDERSEWDLKPDHGYLVVRGGSSAMAFRVGHEPPWRGGFRIIGAHTDSPNLRLKPRAALVKSGCGMLGVEVYGGVLLHTWLDRDLGIAGRLFVSDGSSPTGIRSVTLRVNQPLCRVSSLAIHLDREVNDRGLVLNKQQHLPPMFTLAGSDVEAHERLWSLLSEAAGVSAQDVLGHDLQLFDLTPACVGGARQEFVFAPRLDNLASCHAALSALLAAPTSHSATRLVSVFDHEEIGSTSAQGAASSFLRDVLTRITQSEGCPRGGLERALALSFSISADMAHAVHPNYADKHEPQHMPRLGGGPVLKSNVNVRYATDGDSASQFRAWCKKAGVSAQDFVTRTDLACGSTIGPITSSALGIRTVDVGSPMLSMHSSRELASSVDVATMIRVMATYFE